MKKAENAVYFLFSKFEKPKKMWRAEVLWFRKEFYNKNAYYNDFLL